MEPALFLVIRYSLLVQPLISKHYLLLGHFQLDLGFGSFNQRVQSLYTELFLLMLYKLELEQLLDII
jgi:hypothetical protein